MNGEFHIFASKRQTRFVVRAMDEGVPKEFTSLFEAARHARTQTTGAGIVVIHDAEGWTVNRIPFGVPEDGADCSK
jgi:hypothetical protein